MQNPHPQLSLLTYGSSLKHWHPAVPAESGRVRLRAGGVECGDWRGTGLTPLSPATNVCRWQSEDNIHRCRKAVCAPGGTGNRAVWRRRRDTSGARRAWVCRAGADGGLWWRKPDECKRRKGIVACPVAPTSKSAVSRISKSATLETLNGCGSFGALPIWKSAIQQVWKPALRGSGLQPKVGAPAPTLGHRETNHQPQRGCGECRARWTDGNGRNPESFRGWKFFADADPG